VEEAYARETAEKVNEKVWARVGPMSIKDLKRHFKNACRNLWFHTGDIAYRDEEGYIY